MLIPTCAHPDTAGTVCKLRRQELLAEAERRDLARQATAGRSPRPSRPAALAGSTGVALVRLGLCLRRRPAPASAGVPAAAE